ncbi:hypothetical protein HY990_01370 [Candidatus Micrarchaeota archaeon]|nr:hypothetical protein [Candidatus Micrarchaeota archaeon]
MLKSENRVHPPIITCNKETSTDLIIRIENHKEEKVWVETEIIAPQGLSLAPGSELQKGKMRVGIIESGEYMEKSARIYGNRYTMPKVYQIKTIVFAFDKDGIINQRIEGEIQLRCEKGKPHEL